MRSSMIGNRMRAFALWTAFAIICSAPPALAAQFDGNWNMVAVTTRGHCGRIPIGLGISRSRIYSTGGSFVSYPIQLSGRVSGSGQVRMNAVAGPRIAHVTGRFSRFSGQRDVGWYRAFRSLLGRLDRRPEDETFVVEDEEEILGTYHLRPNWAGGGAHVANIG